MGFYKDDFIELNKFQEDVYGEVDHNGKPFGYAIITKENYSSFVVTEDYYNHSESGITIARHVDDIHIAKYYNGDIDGICLEKRKDASSISFRKYGLKDGVVMYFPNNPYDDEIVFALYEDCVFTGKVLVYKQNTFKPKHKMFYYDLREEPLVEKCNHTAMNAQCLVSKNPLGLEPVDANYRMTDSYDKFETEDNETYVLRLSKDGRSVGYIRSWDKSKCVAEFKDGNIDGIFYKVLPNGVEVLGGYLPKSDEFCGVKYYPDENRYIVYKSKNNDKYIRGLWIDIDENYIWLKCNHFKNNSIPKVEGDFFRIDRKTLQLTRYNLNGEYLESREFTPFDALACARGFTLDNTEYDLSNERVPSLTKPDLSKPNASTMTTIAPPLARDGNNPKFVATKKENIGKMLSNFGYKTMSKYDSSEKRIIVTKVLKMQEMIVVPEGVNELDPGAFMHEKPTLRTVILPSTLDFISKEVFKNCISLEMIDLSKTKIKTLQLYVFENSGVRNIKFPESLKKLEIGAITNCRYLKKLEFPGLEEIEGYGIENCPNLEEIIAPKLKWIWLSAIKDCPNLKRIKIPRSCNIDLVSGFIEYNKIKIEYTD